jgi:hypothetical protein
LAIGVPAVAKLSVELSQPVILPVCPLNVRFVVFVPVQTADEPEIVPPTLAGSTVTVAIAEVVLEQAPLLMIAL